MSGNKTEIQTTHDAPMARHIPINTLAEAFRLAEVIHKAGFAPQLKSPQAVMCALLMGYELGMTPFQAARNVFMIRGKACTDVATQHALVEQSGLLAEFKIAVTGQGEDAKCVVRLRRKGRKDVVESTYTYAEAKTAGLTNSDGWKSYPRRMVKARALGFALQDVFPDVLRGLRTVEEMRDGFGKVVDSNDDLDVIGAPSEAAETADVDAGEAEDADAGEASNLERIAEIRDAMEKATSVRDLEAAGAQLKGVEMLNRHREEMVGFFKARKKLLENAAGHSAAAKVDTALASDDGADPDPENAADAPRDDLGYDFEE